MTKNTFSFLILFSISTVCFAAESSSSQRTVFIPNVPIDSAVTIVYSPAKVLFKLPLRVMERSKKILVTPEKTSVVPQGTSIVSEAILVAVMFENKKVWWIEPNSKGEIQDIDFELAESEGEKSGFGSSIGVAIAFKEDLDSNRNAPFLVKLSDKTQRSANQAVQMLIENRQNFLTCAKK